MPKYYFVSYSHSNPNPPYNWGFGHTALKVIKDPGYFDWCKASAFISETFEKIKGSGVSVLYWKEISEEAYINVKRIEPEEGSKDEQ